MKASDLGVDQSCAANHVFPLAELRQPAGVTGLAVVLDTELESGLGLDGAMVRIGGRRLPLPLLQRLYGDLAELFVTASQYADLLGLTRFIDHILE